MRENAEIKARRYLVEGRLEVQRVQGDEVLARCLGDEGDVYAVVWDGRQRSWRCSCPPLALVARTFSPWAESSGSRREDRANRTVDNAR